MKKNESASTALKGSDPNRMLQFDGLRAFATVLVLAAHFINSNGGLVRMAGIFALQWFFVLSGFLITGILLNSRKRVDSGQQSFGFALRQFYMRRFLRIFPAFYLILALACIFNVGDARSAIVWYATYTANFYFATKTFMTPFIHLWSLCVEEQFYLLWPCFVMFASRRFLVPITILVILASPIYKIVSAPYINIIGRSLLFIGNTESLGLGSLLALAMSPYAGSSSLRPLLTKLGLWVGVPMFASYAIMIAFFHPSDTVQIVYGQFGMALFSTWFIYRTTQGYRHFPGALLVWRPLVYLGTISYGTYLVHFPLFSFWLNARSDGLIPPLLDACRFPILTAVSFFVAATMWHCYERPIQSLKRYFPYSGAPRKRVSDDGSSVPQDSKA